MENFYAPNSMLTDMAQLSGSSLTFFGYIMMIQWFIMDQAWLSKMSSVLSSLLVMFTASSTQLVPQKTGLNINKRFMVQWHLCSGHLKMSISYQKILTNSLVSFIVKNNEKLNLYFVKIRIYHSISFSIG